MQHWSGGTDRALLDHDQAEDKDHHTTNCGEDTDKNKLDNCIVGKNASLFLHCQVLSDISFNRTKPGNVMVLVSIPSKPGQVMALVSIPS